MLDLSSLQNGTIHGNLLENYYFIIIIIYYYYYIIIISNKRVRERGRERIIVYISYFLKSTTQSLAGRLGMGLQEHQ